MLGRSIGKMRIKPASLLSIAALAACAVPSLQSPTVREASRPGYQARSLPLLYISDWKTNDVYIYDYTTGRGVGRLTGFKSPYGQCVNRDGHVWIADLHNFRVVEYAHGEHEPLRSLATTGFPIGCAIDPTTGDLAVANFSAPRSSGSIEVWMRARGKPKTFHPAKLYYLWPPAYDDAGNLFVEGKDKNGPYGLSEIPKGGAALRAIALHGATIHYAAGVVWDGKHLGITDQNANDANKTVIYRAAVKGVTATVVGRAHLTDDCDRDYADVAAPFAVRDASGGTEVVIGPNLWCPGRFGFWSYPSGGLPDRTLPNSPEEPFGESVSPAER